MTQDVNTFIVDLPTSIKSFVRQNDDMTVTIVLNARISREERILAYKHELDHLNNDDLSSDIYADDIERKAHNLM